VNMHVPMDLPKSGMVPHAIYYVDGGYRLVYNGRTQCGRCSTSADDGVESGVVVDSFGDVTNDYSMHWETQPTSMGTCAALVLPRPCA
jgi:hypothetical protein